MSDALTIETVGLRKRYDAVDALRGLDLRVPAGAIFGVLGRNGAGKTTTNKVLLGMTKPTSGIARVFDARPTPATRPSRFDAASASSAKTRTSTTT